MKFIVRTHHFVKHLSASKKVNTYPAEIRTNDVSGSASALNYMDPKVGIRSCSLIRNASALNYCPEYRHPQLQPHKEQLSAPSRTLQSSPHSPDSRQVRGFRTHSPRRSS